jgi:hypothetical protein
MGLFDWVRSRRHKPRRLGAILGDMTAEEVRDLGEDELYEELGRVQTTKVAELLKAEQRHREAWRAPAGKAFWLSIIAVIISAAAFAKSFFG